MNSIETYVTNVGQKLTDSLSKDNLDDVKTSLTEIVNELKTNLEAEPFQAIAASAAIGFFLTQMIRTKGSTIPRHLGRGIGSLVVTRVLEKLSPGYYAGDNGVRH